MNATTTNPTPNIRCCSRCGIKYDWRRSSSSSLKMTYCNALCEAADLGFTIEALLRTEFVVVRKVDWDEVGELARAAMEDNMASLNCDVISAPKVFAETIAPPFSTAQAPLVSSLICLVAMPTGRSSGMPAHARSVVSRSP